MITGHTNYWKSKIGPDYMRSCMSAQDDQTLTYMPWQVTVHFSALERLIRQQ